MSKTPLKINSLLNIIRSLLNVLFPLITFKYASQILGPEGIGAANYSQSVVSYFQLIATFGVTTYATAEGAKIRNNKSFVSFANEMFTFNLVTTIIAYFFVFAFAATGVFGNYTTLILVFSITLFFSTIGVEWLFTIYEQFTYITLRSLLFQVLSLIALFIFVKGKDDLLIYILLIALSSVGSSILNFWKSRSICKLSFVPLSTYKRNFIPLLIIFGTSISSLIYVNSNIIILEYLKDATTVGIYSAAVKIVKVVCVPIASVGIVVLPQIAESIKAENIDRLNYLCKKTLSFMSFFIYPIMLGIFMLSDEAILMLSGEEFLPSSLAIKIMAVDIFLSPINGFIVSQLLISMEKERISLYATIFGAALNIILNFALVPFYSMYGSSVATVVSELIVLLVCLPSLRRTIKFKSLLNDQWQFIIASLPIILITYLFRELISVFWIYTPIIIIVSAIIYLLVLYLLKNNLPQEILNFVKPSIRQNKL